MLDLPSSASCQVKFVGFGALIGRQSEGSLIRGFDNLVLTLTLILTPALSLTLTLTLTLGLSIVRT